MKKLNLTKNQKIAIVINVLMFSTFIALMVLTALGKGKYDLMINKQIARPNNFFGVLFAQVGEIPAYYIIPLASATLFFTIKHYEKIKNMEIRSILLIFILIGYFTYFYKQNLTKRLVDKGLMTKPNFLIYSVFMAILFTCFTLIVFYNLKRQTLYKLSKIALFALCVVVVSLIVSRIFKYTFTRIRYRSFAPNQEWDKFTPWYIASGFDKVKIKDDWNFKSFPSGHTVSAANILVILPLFSLFDKLKKYKKLAIFLSWLFIIAVAVSRIIEGAHFLSDVVFAIIISYATYLLFNYIFFRKGKYEFEYKE